MVGVQPIGENALDGVVVEIWFIGIIDLNGGDPDRCTAGDPGIGIAQADAVGAITDGGIVDIRIAGLGVDAVIAVVDSGMADADVAVIGSDAVSAVTDIDMADGRTAVIGVNTDVSIINIRILSCAITTGVIFNAAPGAGCGGVGGVIGIQCSIDIQIFPGSKIHLRIAFGLQGFTGRDGEIIGEIVSSPYMYRLPAGCGGECCVYSRIETIDSGACLEADVGINGCTGFDSDCAIGSGDGIGIEI